MKLKTSVILAFMMFLQYFVWGSWYVTMGTFMTKFLGSTGIQIGAAYSALAIATMISPFFVGMVADRFFAAQRVMGVLHIIGGVLLFMASRVTMNGPFYWVILLYSFETKFVVNRRNFISLQKSTVTLINTNATITLINTLFQ